MFKVPENYRVQKGRFGTPPNAGNYGAFIIPSPGKNNRSLFVIASSGMGWNHVSVHAMIGKGEAIPYWTEMCFIKDLFWEDSDFVIQYHPKKSDYVNISKTTLHLWQPQNIELPTPPLIMV